MLRFLCFWIFAALGSHPCSAFVSEGAIRARTTTSITTSTSGGGPRAAATASALSARSPRHPDGFSLQYSNYSTNEATAEPITSWLPYNRKVKKASSGSSSSSGGHAAAINSMKLKDQALALERTLVRNHELEAEVSTLERELLLLKRQVSSQRDLQRRGVGQGLVSVDYTRQLKRLNDENAQLRRALEGFREEQVRKVVWRLFFERLGAFHGVVTSRRRIKETERTLARLRRANAMRQSRLLRTVRRLKEEGRRHGSKNCVLAALIFLWWV